MCLIVEVLLLRLQCEAIPKKFEDLKNRLLVTSHVLLSSLRHSFSAADAIHFTRLQLLSSLKLMQLLLQHTLCAWLKIVTSCMQTFALGTFFILSYVQLCSFSVVIGEKKKISISVVSRTISSWPALAWRVQKTWSNQRSRDQMLKLSAEGAFHTTCTIWVQTT